MLRSLPLLACLALAGAALLVGAPAYAQDPPPLPPPPPPFAGYRPTGPPPGYSDQAPAPRSSPGATTAVHFEPDQPGVHLLSLSGEAPFETIGWYVRGGVARPAGAALSIHF